MSSEFSSTDVNRCPLCGEPLLENPEGCSKCDWVRGYRHPRALPRNPRDFAAAGLSIFPGVGHVFKGYKMLGWLLLFLGVPVIVVFAFAFTMFFGWLLVPAYWIAVGADAYFRKDLRLPEQDESVTRG
jgi:hypothetical protein